MADNRFTKSSNPILSEKTFEKSRATGISSTEIMTVAGAVNKSLILFSLLMITTFISYQMPSVFLLLVGAIGGLIAVIVGSFKPATSPIAAPIYALLEGLFVGSVSAMYAVESSGIVLQAVTLTFSTLFMMLLVYKSGMIKVTQKFRTGVMMATGAIFLVYMVSFIGSFLGFSVPYLHEGGIMGIGISVVIIGVAALNLLLDFDMFDRGEQMQAPRYMEWFCAMGLLVTLVWLYIEFLRLLSKLRD